MTHRIHPIAVKQLPQIMTSRQEHLFLLDLESYLRADRPRIVIDCAALLQMDRAALQMLICCLEEAMKRNGDVKLAGLSEASIAVLERSGVRHLFESYATTTEAVSSFRRVLPGASMAAVEAGTAKQPSETAA
jgi:anti-anti-sigma factor